MKCCEKCKDYIKIPKSAIFVGDKVKVIQNFPFLCKQKNRFSECLSNECPPVHYTLINVKEYQSELVSGDKATQQCLNEYLFDKHVEIVINGTYSSDINFRVRCGTHNTNEMQILKKFDYDQGTNAPDSYYTISDDQIKIYTKHFSLFFIDAGLENKSELFAEIRETGDCEKLIELVQQNASTCKPRIVSLITHAYYAQTEINNDAKRRKMSLFVYVRDENHEKMDELKKKTESQFNSPTIPYKTLKPFGSPLIQPEVIRKQSTFQCNAVFAKGDWKESKGDAVGLL